jgi:hypothetical protein
MPYKLLATIASAGFLSALICHVMALVGTEPPGGQRVMIVLHIGIFPLWFLLIISVNRTKSTTGSASLNHLFAELPKWVRTLSGLVTAYAVVNFIYFLYQTSQYPKHQVPFLVQLRGFSGHWMIFYGISATGFLGLERLAQKQKDQTR